MSWVYTLMQGHIHKIKIQVRISWTSMLYTTINVVYNHVVLYLDWQWKLHNERNMYAHKTNFLPLDACPTQTSLRVFFQFRFQPLDTLLNNWFHWRNKNTAFQQSVQRLETKLKEDTAIVVWGGVRRRYRNDQIMWLESNHRAPINKSYYSSNFHPPS